MSSWFSKMRMGCGSLPENPTGTTAYGRNASLVPGQTRLVISAPVPVPFESFLEARSAFEEVRGVSVSGGETARHPKKRNRLFSLFVKKPTGADARHRAGDC